MLVVVVEEGRDDGGRGGGRLYGGGRRGWWMKVLTSPYACWDFLQNIMRPKQPPFFFFLPKLF